LAETHIKPGRKIKTENSGGISSKQQLRKAYKGIALLTWLLLLTCRDAPDMPDITAVPPREGPIRHDLRGRFKTLIDSKNEA